MTAFKLAYTCDDLGACQSRNPRCKGCTAAQHFPFAPGVIDHSPKPYYPALTKWLVRWVWLMLVVVAVCFAAGYLS